MKKVLFATLAFSLVFTACRKDKDHDVSYRVNENTSVALWKGSTSETSNNGSFQVTSTKLTVNNNNVVNGNFIIPIASISNFNLPDELKPVLINHLKSSDFFNIVLHPEAKFAIKTVRPYIGNGDGAVTGANQFVTGDFTMIGKTFTISFPAKIEFAGDSVKVAAKFKIDRTNWGMNYESDPEGEHYINKNVEIELDVRAGKTK